MRYSGAIHTRRRRGHCQRCQPSAEAASPSGSLPDAAALASLRRSGWPPCDAIEAARAGRAKVAAKACSQLPVAGDRAASDSRVSTGALVAAAVRASPGVVQTLHCLVRGGWAQDDRTGSLLALGVQQKHVPLVTELLQQWAAAQQAGSDTGDGDRHAAAAPSAGEYFGATDAATGGTLLHMALDNRRLVLDIAHKRLSAPFRGNRLPWLAGLARVAARSFSPAAAQRVCEAAEAITPGACPAAAGDTSLHPSFGSPAVDPAATVLPVAHAQAIANAVSGVVTSLLLRHASPHRHRRRGPHGWAAVWTADRLGRTPLHVAGATGNDIAAVQLLRAHPALAAARDVFARTAADMARDRCHTRACVLLGGDALECGSRCTGNSTAGAHAARATEVAPQYEERGVDAKGVAGATHEADKSQAGARRRGGSSEGDDGHGGWGTASLRGVEPSQSQPECNIDEVTGRISPEAFVREYLVPGRPVVLRGYAADWPMRRRLTREALLAAHGGDTFSVGEIPYASAYGAGGGLSTLRSFLAGAHMSGSAGDDAGRGRRGHEHVSRAAQEPPQYMFSNLKTRTGRPLGGGTADWLRHLVPLVPPFLNTSLLRIELARASGANEPHRPSDASDASSSSSGGSSGGSSSNTGGVPAVSPSNLNVQLYVGGPGSGAPPHVHKSAWNALAWGVKRWHMLPPDAALVSLTPAARWFHEHLRCECPGHSGDAHEGPQQVPGGDVSAKCDACWASGAAGVHRYCTQRAGDIMFVPPHWSHSVVNVQASVGVAVEFDSMCWSF